MGDTLVDAGQSLSGSSAVVGAALFPRQLSVSLSDGVQFLLEDFWRVDLHAITAGEKGREPEVRACTFTCHGPDYWLRDNETREVHVQITQHISFDGHRFDRA